MKSGKNFVKFCHKPITHVLISHDAIQIQFKVENKRTFKLFNFITWGEKYVKKPNAHAKSK